jgi:intein/homing endonuclease
MLKTAFDRHKPILAEFVGRILGDGSPIIAPNYYASEIESQKRMQYLVTELFDYSPKIGIAKGHYRIQLKRLCGYTLQLLGIPLGRKSVTNPRVPKFIMDSTSPLVWLSFLRGLFDDEAYVSDRGIEIGLAVRQTNSRRNPVGSRILDSVSELLGRLGIQHVRRKGQTYKVGEMQSTCWFLRIPKREFQKVHQLRLLLLPCKQRKLVAAQESVCHQRT